MRKTLRQRIDDAEARLADAEALQETLERLVSDGEISREHAERVGLALERQLGSSRYILRHLGAHLTIGVIFAFDVVPLPLGTVARVSWVAGSRLVEVARRNREQAKVHSVGVFLIAAIPWLGYSAYLLPLRRRNRELAFVLANHTWLGRTGRTFEETLAEARLPLRRLGRWLVPVPAPVGGTRHEQIPREGP